MKIKKIFEKVNKSEMARQLTNLKPPITGQAVGKWKQVPLSRVVDVEKITGISRHVLRADVSRIFREPKS